jgi:hypothetical protein
MDGHAGSVSLSGSNQSRQGKEGKEREQTENPPLPRQPNSIIEDRRASQSQITAPHDHQQQGQQEHHVIAKNNALVSALRRTATQQRQMQPSSFMQPLHGHYQPDLRFMAHTNMLSDQRYTGMPAPPPGHFHNMAAAEANLLAYHSHKSAVPMPFIAPPQLYSFPHPIHDGVTPEMIGGIHGHYPSMSFPLGFSGPPAMPPNGNLLLSSVPPMQADPLAPGFGHPLPPEENRQPRGPLHGLANRSPISMYMDCDEGTLTEYQCLLRKQVQLFEAKPNDIKRNAQGRNTVR